MTDSSSSDNTPPVPHQQFVGRWARFYGLGGLIVLGSVAGSLLFSLRHQTPSTETWVLLAFLGAGLLASGQLLFSPPRFAVEDGLFRMAAPVELSTPLANLRSITFDDGSLAVVFHNIDEIQPPETAAKFRNQAQGEVRLIGYTLTQVEEIRQRLGMPLPNPEEPGGRAEAFHRTLLAAVPHVHVTGALLGLNIALFGLMVLSGVSLLNPQSQSLIQWGANFGPLTTHGEWWRLITSTFLHIGVFHLLCNMWALWDVGALMERLVGPFGLLVLYLLAGLAGSVASLYWNPEIISAGASGSIFGLFGGLLGVVILRRDQMPMEAVRRLRRSGLTFLAFNLYIGFTVPGIDLAAHLGGWAFGLVGGLLLSRPLGGASPRPWPWRPLLLAGGGGLAVFVAASFVPPAPRDLPVFEQVVTEFTAAEKEILDSYNTVVKGLQAGKTTEEEVANVLERTVLPRWRDYHRRLREIGKIPSKKRKRLQTLLEYMEAREEGWDLLLQAIRTQDQNLSSRAADKFQLAERVLERMKKE